VTTEKHLQLLEYYRSVLYCGFVYPRELTAEEKAKPFSKVGALSRRQHVLWMCSVAKNLVAEGRTEKAMRWLGFIQNYITMEPPYLAATYSLEDLKHHSRPETVLINNEWVMESAE
jgi:hypothetical protein